jgi:hypothetical protein
MRASKHGGYAHPMAAAPHPRRCAHPR